MSEDELSKIIIGAAIETHRALGGPGLLEDVYEEALCYELGLRGLKVQRQVRFDLKYKGQTLNKPLILDLLVENKIIIEVKAVEDIRPIFKAQLLTYLRQTDKRLGLLINFGAERVAQGIHRVANKL